MSAAAALHFPALLVINSHTPAAAPAPPPPVSPITDRPPPAPQSSPNPDYKPHATLLILTHTNTAFALLPSLTTVLSRLSPTETCAASAVAHNKIALAFSHTSFDFFSAAAATAAALPGTIHVQPRAHVHISNYYATGNIQTGTMNPVPGASPLWSAGSYSPLVSNRV
jgi:hypothetical protein